MSLTLFSHFPTGKEKNAHVCVFCFSPSWVWVSVLDLCVGTERNSRERDRGSTLAVPEQKRPIQHRSRSVSPHREDCCRARSRPAHVPMQRSGAPLSHPSIYPSICVQGLISQWGFTKLGCVHFPILFISSVQHVFPGHSPL